MRNVQNTAVMLVAVLILSTMSGYLYSETAIDSVLLEDEQNTNMADDTSEPVEMGVVSWAWDCLSYSTQEICDTSYLEGESHNSYLDILVDSSTNLKIRNLPGGANDEMVHMDAIVAFTGNKEVIDHWGEYRTTYHAIQLNYEDAISEVDTEQMEIPQFVSLEMQSMLDVSKESCQDMRSDEETATCEAQIDSLSWLVNLFNDADVDELTFENFETAMLEHLSENADEFNVKLVSVFYASYWFWSNPGDLMAELGANDCCSNIASIDAENDETFARGGISDKLKLIWKIVKGGFDAISYAIGDATDNQDMMDGASHSVGHGIANPGGGGHVIGGDPLSFGETQMCAQESWLDCSVRNILDENSGMSEFNEIWNGDDYCPLKDADSIIICVNSMKAGVFHNRVLDEISTSSIEFGGMSTYSLDRWNSYGGTTDEFVNDVVSNMDLIMLNTGDDEMISQYLTERSDFIESERDFWKEKTGDEYTYEDIKRSAVRQIEQVQSYCSLNCTTMQWLTDLLDKINGINDDTTLVDFDVFFEEVFSSQAFIEEDITHPHKQSAFLMYSTFQASDVYWGEDLGRVGPFWKKVLDWVGGACGWAGNMMNLDGDHASQCWDAGKESRKSAESMVTPLTGLSFTSGEICQISLTANENNIASKNALADCISNRLTDVDSSLSSIKEPWFEGYECPDKFQLAACLDGIIAGQEHNDMLTTIHESEAELGIFAFVDSRASENLIKLDMIVTNSGNTDYISAHREVRAELMSEFEEISSNYKEGGVTAADLAHYLHTSESSYPELDGVLSDVNSFVLSAIESGDPDIVAFEGHMNAVFKSDEYLDLVESGNHELIVVLNQLHASYSASDSYWDDAEGGRAPGNFFHRLVDRSKLLINDITPGSTYDDGARWGQAVYSLYGSRAGSSGSDDGSADNSWPGIAIKEGQDSVKFEEACSDDDFKNCVDEQIQAWKAGPSPQDVCGEDLSMTTIEVTTDQQSYSTGDDVELTTNANCLIVAYGYDVEVRLVRIGVLPQVNQLVSTFTYRTGPNMEQDSWKETLEQLDASEYCVNARMSDSGGNLFIGSTCFDMFVKSAVDPKDDDSGFLPGFGFLSTLICLLGVAIILQRKQQENNI